MKKITRAQFLASPVKGSSMKGVKNDQSLDLTYSCQNGSHSSSLPPAPSYLQKFWNVMLTWDPTVVLIIIIIIIIMGL